MCDKKKSSINTNNGNGTKYNDNSIYHSFEHIRENAGTTSTKPFDVSLMTGTNTNNTKKNG